MSEKSKQLSAVTSALVVYTAIFGEYDELKNVEGYAEGIDFICFTDTDITPKEPWRIVKVKSVFKHPRMDAKFYKLHPHLFFPNSNFSLWLDGSVEVLDKSFFEYLMAYHKDSILALFQHPERTNILDEASFSLTMKKYESLPLLEQVDSYRSNGFTEERLFACTLLWRQHQSKYIIDLMQDWWNENVIWSYQDQLSLPYVIWKNAINPSIIELELWNNHYFKVTGHTSQL